jgi:hypothetical protein
MPENPGVGIDALSAVHEITAKIVASLDLDQTTTIARAMCEVLSADAARNRVRRLKAKYVPNQVALPGATAD